MTDTWTQCLCDFNRNRVVRMLSNENGAYYVAAYIDGNEMLRSKVSNYKEIKRIYNFLIADTNFLQEEN